MVRLTNEQRQITILAAAHEVYMRQGLHEVTHATVSAACKVPVSERTVRRVFPLKDDLWKALIANHPDDELLGLQAAGLGFEG